MDMIELVRTHKAAAIDTMGIKTGKLLDLLPMNIQDKMRPTVQDAVEDFFGDIGGYLMYVKIFAIIEVFFAAY